MNCSPPGSSVHGILQARILEWVAMPFSRGLNLGLLNHRQILYHLSCREALLQDDYQELIHPWVHGPIGVVFTSVMDYIQLHVTEL